MKSLEFLSLAWLGRQSASPANGLGEVVAKPLQQNRVNTCAPSMQGREILMIAI